MVFGGMIVLEAIGYTWLTYLLVFVSAFGQLLQSPFPNAEKSSLASRERSGESSELPGLE